MHVCSVYAYIMAFMVHTIPSPAKIFSLGEYSYGCNAIQGANVRALGYIKLDLFEALSSITPVWFLVGNEHSLRLSSCPLVSSLSPIQGFQGL